MRTFLTFTLLAAFALLAARAGADDGYLTKGGTGFGVRTLVELARAFEPPAAAGNGTVKVTNGRRRR